ncbi:alkaline phosphatase family protein [Cellulomonas shaoxiangyii]|uniref:Phosphodiesterase n=1 Tax=Cellulomonas shaoxiangyii TaxID=2566013 RepID=A0A4V1CMS2_9CELL|nr:alkaline phosphatase family protein [Cellulomonas shaoxiangyii]QCB93935.1 phosphodiesterase [Cellulomonas shaoxiangyii]TGY86008.1 phosphodiesterase [Cellulomonas shaoxiangyii]
MPGPRPAPVPGTSASSRRRSRTRFADVADVAEVAVAVGTTAVGLGVAVALVDDVRITSPWALLLAAAAVGLGAHLLAGPLRAFARVAGAGGALVAGLAAQVLVVGAALTLVPGVTVTSVWSVLAVLAVTAVVMAAGRWAWGASDNAYVVADLVRRARRRARRGDVPALDAADGDRPPAGVLLVQLDGVGLDVLELAVDAGLAPTVQRWVEEGTHRLRPWWASVPSTTPASQAGILHGAADAIPAFRWWDRDLRRLVVTNRPDDAALVEERLTDGRGLLAGGGTAVSTMFSGDAASSYLVMSRGRRHGLGPGPGYVGFFARPFVLGRAVVLTVGEAVKELYQARRQRVHDVRPRVSRGGWYVLLRAVTNVLLRDLTTSLVADALVRGDPVVYVDLVDYDEVAHHAGPTRPESLRSLEGLDQVLRLLEQVADAAPRAYDVVVLSDHGQALGPTFEEVEGRSLLATVRALMAEPGAAGVQSAGGEAWGPLNALLTSVRRTGDPVVLGPDAGDDRARGRAGAPAGDDGGHGRGHGSGHRSGHGRVTGSGRDVPDVVVAGSGNLGLVWFPAHDRRPVLEELAERWPALVPGLAARPGVGLVVADSRGHGLVAVGRDGVRALEADGDDGAGADPLAAYPARARSDLVRAARLPGSGDLLLVSAVDPRGRVHAFEGQVGSHGGIGGPQNGAFLLHPAAWEVDDALCGDVDGARVLVGADAVHHQLVAWLRACGARS